MVELSVFAFLEEKWCEKDIDTDTYINVHSERIVHKHTPLPQKDPEQMKYFIFSSLPSTLLLLAAKGMGEGFRLPTDLEFFR